MRRGRKLVTVLYENLVHAPNACALFRHLHLRTVALHAGIEGTLRKRIIFSWSHFPFSRTKVPYGTICITKAVADWVSHMGIPSNGGYH